MFWLQLKLGVEMNYVGIDPSATGTGLVVMDDVERVLIAEKVTGPKGSKRIARASSIAEAVVRFVKHLDPSNTIVVIEGYAYGNKFSLATLVEVGTLIRYWLQGAGFTVYEPAPTAVKAFVGVKGSDKKKMAKAVKEFYGYEHKSHDVIDAYVMARMAEVRTKRSTAKNKQQLTTIDGMKSQK